MKAKYSYLISIIFQRLFLGILISGSSLLYANESLIIESQIGDVYVAPEEFFDATNPLLDTDLEAIQAAIDDAVSQVGFKKILCLQPRKVYLVDAQIDGKGVSIKGNNARFKKATQGSLTSFVILNYNQTQDFYLHNLIVEGDETVIASDPKIKISGCTNVKIKNCKFLTSSSTTLQIINSSKISIHESTFEGIGALGATNHEAIDIKVTDGNHGYINITNNTFRSIQNNGISTSCSANPSAALAALTIRNNTFSSIEGTALQLTAGNAIMIANNITKTCNKFVTIGLTKDSENYTISGNVVSEVISFFQMETSNSLTNLLVNGNVHIGGTDFVKFLGDAAITTATFSGNIVSGISGYIYLGKGKDIAITNNQFSYSGAVDWPLFITDAQRVRVEGNSFKSLNPHDYIINIPPTSTPGHNIIRHNSFNTNFTSERQLVNPSMWDDLTNVIHIQ